MDVTTDMIRWLRNLEGGLRYVLVAREALTPEALGKITEKAVADAERGDASARQWLQAAGGSHRSGS